MMTFLQNFHFIRPLWLVALIVPIIFYLKFYKGMKNNSSWEKVVDKNLLQFLLIKGSSRNRKWLGYLALSAFCLAILAISGPTWNNKEIPNLKAENPVMVLLNLSSDTQVSDIKPNRLMRAKYEISDLMASLKSIQSGLIVYSDEPYLISPITEDTNVVINLLSAVDINIMPDNGDRLDRAIEMAVTKLKDAKYRNGNIVIISSDVGQKFDLALKQATNAAKQGYFVSVLNVSLSENEKLNLIAQNGGGIYTIATPDDEDIKVISQKINQEYNMTLKQSENLSQVWEEYGYYLSFLILAICLYFFRRGILIIALTTTFTLPAQAGFFLNPNQEGLKEFNAGEFDKASQTFDDSMWKASALYRAGKFEEAYKEYAKYDDEENLYNQGNALAKSGDIEEAIKKYEEVLRANPNHEDAKFNLEYLKQQQNQNQNQQQNQNDSEQNDEEKNQQNQPKEEQSDASADKDNESSEEKKQDSDANAPPQEQSENQQSEEQNTAQENQSLKDVENQEGDDEVQQAAKPEQKDENWDEELQAREQQYREIPENPGGLLKAFIKKEHNKNRYRD